MTLAFLPDLLNTAGLVAIAYFAHRRAIALEKVTADKAADVKAEVAKAAVAVASEVKVAKKENGDALHEIKTDLSKDISALTKRVKALETPRRRKP